MSAPEPSADMPSDIRDRPALEHEDVIALNFIRSAAPRVFRRYFRQGLRSHIMEILDPDHVRIEKKGTRIDGIRHFPRARPRQMLRIFRSRLKTLDRALKEIQRVKLVERYLAPAFMALSVECIVSYRSPAGMELMLCGFQEFVDGENVDPWNILDATDLLPSLYDAIAGRRHRPMPSRDRWLLSARREGARLVNHLKRMILESGHIPDLAGAGNLILTADGTIRLVDINNITPVRFDDTIPVDEKGYPVCDKSIEALALIESKIVGADIDGKNRLYGHFLDPVRRNAVEAREKAFWERHRTDGR
jgi:hypothetical protein